MTHDIMDFIEYIHNEKQTSKNTEVSYERDLRKMNEYLEAQNVYGVSAVTETNLNAYVMFLEREGRKPATVSRSIASMKAFFHFLEKERRIESDPAWRLKAPKIENDAAYPDHGRSDAFVRAAVRKYTERAAG